MTREKVGENPFLRTSVSQVKGEEKKAVSGKSHTVQEWETGSHFQKKGE